MVDRIRAALFVDFDNIFGGLAELDASAALAFAERPQVWLERLARGGPAAGWRRDFLVRRCYLNPSGWRASPQLGPDRVYFSRFRPFLTRAGFEVVDCPSLTSRHKNAADIRLVLDVIDAVQHVTRFDEILLFSGDADFTPLLQRLRAHDRRTTVASSSQTATAYRGIADVFLDEQALIDLVLGVDAGEEDAGPPAGGAVDLDVLPAGAGPPALARHDVAELRRQAVALATEAVARSPVAVNLAELGLRIRAELGQAVTATRWFGEGNLTGAISGPETADLRITRHHIWDPDRHEPPRDADLAERPWVPPLVDRLVQLTAMPRLTADDFQALFVALAEYLAAQPFNLTDITRAVRDRLRAEGRGVSRQAIAFVVRGALYGGRPLNASPPPLADDIAGAFFRSVLQSATAAQLALTDEERRELHRWLVGSGDVPGDASATPEEGNRES